MDDAFHISTRQRCNDDCLSRFQSESATSIAPPFCKTIKPNYFFCSRSSVSLELGLRCLHNLTGIKSVNLALSNYSSINSVIILLIMQRFLTTEFFFEFDNQFPFNPLILNRFDYEIIVFAPIQK